MKRVESTNNKPKKKSRVTTVNDILAHDSVNNILDQLEQHKGDIDNIIVICVERNEDYRFLTSEMTDPQIIYILEAVKFDVLRANSPFEEE